MNKIFDFNKFNEKIKHLEKDATAHWEKYYEIQQEIKEKFEKELDLIGKYVKIEDGTHLHIEECFSTTHFDRKVILLRGLGFNCEFTEYRDANYCTWDLMQTYYIDMGEMFDMKAELSKIKEITKEQFQEAFDNMISNVIDTHNEAIKKIENE